MAATAGVRKDQYRVTVTVDGADTGVWDKSSGGGIDSDAKPYRPGGMGEVKTLGGQKSVDDMTLSRLYDHDLYVMLIEKVGAAAVVVTTQPLDPDGVAFVAPTVARGVLKKVQGPEHDGDSTDPAMLEIEVTVATVTAS